MNIIINKIIKVKNNSMKKFIVFILVLAVLVGAGVLVWQNYFNESEPEQVFCTMEAKLCPDGSYVGRTGPNCEFAQCPGN